MEKNKILVSGLKITLLAVGLCFCFQEKKIFWLFIYNKERKKKRQI